MAWQIMDRRASDNKYLHKDFHGALSCGLDYLNEKYGAAAVTEYLRDFTLSYYAPLRDKIRQEGLSAMRAHYEKMYAIEEAEVHFEDTGDTLVMRVPECPAVVHMRKNNRDVSDLWVETERTVNAALVEGMPFEYKLLEYDAENGRSVQVFRKVVK